METYSKTTLGMSVWDMTTQREITKSSRRELSNIKIKNLSTLRMENIIIQNVRTLHNATFDDLKIEA